MHAAIYNHSQLRINSEASMYVFGLMEEARVPQEEHVFQLGSRFKPRLQFWTQCYENHIALPPIITGQK